MGEKHYIVADDLGLNTVRVRGYSHVNLDFAQGKAYAVCAPSRSGKKELLLTIAGRMLATEGSLAVGGVDATRLRGLNTVRKLSGLSIFEHVNELEPALSVATVTSAELGLAGKKSGRAATHDYLAAWGLADVARSKVDELDRYTYDLLGIALGMCSDPQILVVADIERDLTEAESMRLCALLCELASARGTTVVCGALDESLAKHFDGVYFLGQADRQLASASPRLREVA